MGLRIVARAAVAFLACSALFALSGCDKPRTGPDLSNPKAAAVTFAEALQRGDTQTARMATNAGGMELDLVDAMADCASGVKRLTTVAKAKFGDEAYRLVSAHGPAGIATDLSGGDVDQNAEQATVKSKDGKTKLRLRFVDGVWKVDVGVLIGGADITGIVPQFRAAGIASRKVADDVESGKCKTIDEAIKEMGQSLTSAVPDLLRKEIAATMPVPAGDSDSGK